MSSNKKVLEEAVIEYEQIFEAAKATTKSILMSKFDKDIDRLVQESMDLEEKDDESKDSDDKDEISDVTVSPESDDDSSPLGDAISDVSVSDEKTDDEADNSVDPLAGEVSDMGADDEMPGMGDMDLTGASDDDVIQVFRKLKDDDTVEVVKDDNGINLKTDTDEFYIKLNENDNFSSDEEVIYEIEMDDEDDDYMLDDIMSDDNLDYDSNSGYDEDESIDEVARTHSDGRKQLRKPVGFYQYAQSRLRPEDKGHGINESTNKDLLTTKNLLKESIKEKDELNDDLSKYKDALRGLRENMKELAVFNNNLAYSVKLFMEHATTKAEKESVIARFDAVNSINESKALYKTISNEFKSNKPLLEKVNAKIETSRQSGSSVDLNIINESKDTSLDRTKELMAKINKNFKN